MAFNYFNLVGNAELVKQLNYAMIYRLIAQQGPISRIQLAEISHLAPASITKITRQLLKSKLIKEIDIQQSTGGRPAVSIVANTSPFQAIAIQLSRTDITIELYDLGGNLLATKRHLFTSFLQEKVEHYLLSIIAQFLAIYRNKITHLIAIALVMPGLIDVDKGIVKYTPHIKVDNWNIATIIKQRFTVPCYIGNDVQSIALAEHFLGASQKVDDSILIRVHHGIGAGIIMNQQLFVNHNQSMGEVGHIQIDPLGERCHCGNFGCLENTIMSSAIEQRAQKLLEQGYTTKLTLNNCCLHQICFLANQGDALCTHLIQQVGKDLGRAVAILVNLFNPQMIVIAGEITTAAEILLPIINRCLSSQTLAAFRNNLTICRSLLNDYSAIGAFAIIQQAMFNGSLLITLLNNIE
ncbi:MAG: ROK family protein [Candidatus Schmidhempelia sp.]|nr:ROK family protein [Candidatus Schmidhempelia sp.]